MLLYAPPDSIRWFLAAMAGIRVEAAATLSFSTAERHRLDVHMPITDGHGTGNVQMQVVP